MTPRMMNPEAYDLVMWRAKELARLLRRANFRVQREREIVWVAGPYLVPPLGAQLNLHPFRPYIGVMALKSEKGTGQGTKLVDALVRIVREMKLRGLALVDASEGAEEGRGFWRAYAAKRGLTLELDEVHHDITDANRARAVRMGFDPGIVEEAARKPLTETLLVVDPNVAHVGLLCSTRASASSPPPTPPGLPARP